MVTPAIRTAVCNVKFFLTQKFTIAKGCGGVAKGKYNIVQFQGTCTFLKYLDFTLLAGDHD